MIIIATKIPIKLLSSIKAAIDAGHIVTWSYDSDGDFTHTPPQWKGKAWLRPSTADDALKFGILGQRGVSMTVEYYAVYHGRFIEMLAAHFDSLFSTAAATAKPQGTDLI